MVFLTRTTTVVTAPREYVYIVVGADGNTRSMVADIGLRKVVQSDCVIAYIAGCGICCDHQF